MNWRIFVTVGASILVSSGAVAAGPFTSLHPEEAIPNPQGQVSPDPYTNFIKLVQEQLLKQGFDAGPLNGDFGEKTQAALVQFQLSRNIPAGGQLDDQTLAELGVAREERTAGVSQEPAGVPQEPAAAAGATAGESAAARSSPPRE